MGDKVCHLMLRQNESTKPRVGARGVAGVWGGEGDKLQHPGICRCRVEDLNDASVTNVVQSPRVTSCSPRGGWEQNGHGVLCAYETPDVCVYRACRDLDGHVVR